MKVKFLILALILTSSVSFAEDAKVILKKSFEKCQSVKNGYYEMTNYWKYMSKIDTSITSFKCTFRKLNKDTVTTTAFHYCEFSNGDYSGETMDTGDEIVQLWRKDSSGIITNKEKWPDEAKYCHLILFEPLTNNNSAPLPADSDYVNGKYTFQYIAEENVNNTSCYHVQMNEVPVNDSTASYQYLLLEYHFWVNKSDWIPVQYSLNVDMVMNNDTMTQYSMYSLNKYELNNLKDDSYLKLSSIPKYYKLEDYAPSDREPPLPKDTIAPAWSLYSLNDEKVSLSDFSGKLVLIDFFHKSCMPCMQALPVLQSLHKKYKDKGLVVIGIDPYDKKEDGIATMLSKRGITYKVLLGGKGVATSYRVRGYPTMYLIDRNGVIIYRQSGFGPGLETQLEEVIRKYLFEQ